MKNYFEQLHYNNPERLNPNTQQIFPAFSKHLVWQKDSSGRYLWCNEAFAKSVKIRSDQIHGLTDYDIYPKDIAAKYIAQDREVMESGCELTFDETSNHGESITYWKTHKFPLRDAENKIVGTFGESVEITDIIMNNSRHLEADALLIVHEKQLNNIIEHLPGFVYHCLNDPNWTMLYLSNRFSEITGYDKEEVLHNAKISYNDLIHPDDRVKVYSEWEKSLNDGCEFEGEYRIITKTDRVIWVWERGKGIRDDKGNLLFIDGIVLDITQKKEAVEKKIEIEDRFKRLAENANDIIFRYDLFPEPRLTYINPAVERITGFSVEECLANQNIALSNLHKEDQPFMQQMTQNLKPSDKPFTMRWQHKNGEWLWMETKVVPVFDKNNQLIAVEGITRDVTDNKTIDNQIATERILLRTIIDSVPDTLYVKDTEGRKILANKAEMKILNVNSIEEYYGKPDTEFYSKEAGEKYWADDQEVLKSRKPKLNIEEKVIDKFGKVYWILSSKVPLYDKDGNLIGLVGVGRDISERKKLEDELEKYRNHLEELVKERTTELEEKNRELQRLNDIFVGREFRIKELKEKIKELQQEIDRSSKQ